jgi:hypothetical protein
VTFAELKRDLVILTCAISAGIHAALTPAHFAEGNGAGVGFVVAAGLLAAAAVGLTVRPSSAFVLVGAAAVLAGLIGSYVLAVTTGIPVLHPDPEPVAGLALATKAIELLGLTAAITTSHAKGTVTWTRELHARFPSS